MKLTCSSSKPKVLITAGPTREYLDPVRFLTNSSSGKTGYALAEAAARDGSDVILISGPVNIKAPGPIKPVFVETARQMFAQVKKYIKKSDIFISAAAVCDFKPRKFARHKIKKAGHSLKLELLPNPDILAYVSANIPERSKKIVAGFSLETNNLIRNSVIKMRSKKTDLIVANTCGNIGEESGEGYIIRPLNGKVSIDKIRQTRKDKFAGIIWKAIKKLYYEKISSQRIS